MAFHAGNLTFEEVGPVLMGMQGNLGISAVIHKQSSGYGCSDGVSGRRLHSGDFLHTFNPIHSMNATGGTQTLASCDHTFQVSATAVVLDASLDQVNADISVVQALLAEISTFDGTVSVSQGTSTTTPAQLLVRTQDQTTRHQGLYQEGSRAWAAIQNMTNIIVQSNGSIQVLGEQVSAAMQLLGEAILIREYTEGVLYGGVYAEYANNADKLTNMTVTLGSLASDLAVMQEALREADNDIRAANATIRRVGVEVGAQAEVIQLDLEETQQTKYNATQALKAAQVAETAVNEYKVCELTHTFVFIVNVYKA